MSNVTVLAKPEYKVGDRVRTPLTKSEGVIAIVIPYAETTMGKGLHIVVKFPNGHVACAPACNFTRMMKEF